MWDLSWGLFLHPRSDFLLRYSIYPRIGECEDITGLATFLATDESSYITGETITVTGGVVGRL